MDHQVPQSSTISLNANTEFPISTALRVLLIRNSTFFSQSRVPYFEPTSSMTKTSRFESKLIAACLRDTEFSYKIMPLSSNLPMVVFLPSWIVTYMGQVTCSLSEMFRRETQGMKSSIKVRRMNSLPLQMIFFGSLYLQISQKSYLVLQTLADSFQLDLKFLSLTSSHDFKQSMQMKAISPLQWQGEISGFLGESRSQHTLQQGTILSSSWSSLAVTEPVQRLVSLKDSVTQRIYSCLIQNLEGLTCTSWILNSLLPSFKIWSTLRGQPPLNDLTMRQGFSSSIFYQSLSTLVILTFLRSISLTKHLSVFFSWLSCLRKILKHPMSLQKRTLLDLKSNLDSHFFLRQIKNSCFSSLEIDWWMKQQCQEVACLGIGRLQTQARKLLCSLVSFVLKSNNYPESLIQVLMKNSIVRFCQFIGVKSEKQVLIMRVQQHKYIGIYCI